MPSRTAELEREIVALRQRVIELQKRLAGFSGEATSSRRGGLEASLSEREQLLLEAERVAHVGSWIWNVEDNQVTWSDELYRILGYDPMADEASTQGFFARVHPHDRERVQALAVQTAKDGITRQTDCRIQRPDGSIREVSMNGAMLFDREGNLRRVVGTVLDLTDEIEIRDRLRRSDTFLADAQSVAHVGYWSMVPGESVMRCSRELWQLVGLDPGPIVDVDRFIDRIHHEDRSLFRRLRQLAVSTDQVQEAPLRLVARDGELHHVRISATADRDEAGRVVELRGVVMDVTTTVILQEQLARASMMESLGQLAAGIAHDFNNAMSVVLANTNMLEGEATDERLVAIRRAVESAQALTRRLLAFGRKLPLRRTAVDINDVVAGTLDFIRGIIGERIVVKADLADKLPPVEIDVDLIGQALINLLINARDALPDGGEIVVVTKHSGEWVEITITDSGEGLEPEARNRIFEPFYTTKIAGSGAGLGLSMVHGTVTQHGGQVSVVSRTDVGTTFEIRLPVAADSSDALVSARENTAPQDQCTVLVIEDEWLLQRAIQGLLEADGHRALVAGGPERALELVEEEGANIDLILSDVALVGITGPELLVRLASVCPAPVVYMTGYGADALRGVDAEIPILLKPFTREQLASAMARALGQHSVDARSSAS